jgi:cell division initiation protein
MIDLTPLEVRQKKGDFRRAVRGYDPELVNDFLDLVADRMEELVRENLALRDEAEAVAQEVASYRQKEQALSDALMTAQRLSEDARKNAEKEGELLLREAQLQARGLRDEAARQLVREQEAVRHVRARRAQLVESFRRLLDRELAELDILEEALELGGGESTRPGSREEAPADGPHARASADRSSGEPPPAPGAVESAPEKPVEEVALSARAGPEPAPGGAGAQGRQEDGSADDEEEEGPVQDDWLSSLRKE